MNFEENLYNFKNYHDDLVYFINELLADKFPDEEDFDLAWDFFRSYQEKRIPGDILNLKKISLHLENEKNRRLFLNL